MKSIQIWALFLAISGAIFEVQCAEISEPALLYYDQSQVFFQLRKNGLQAEIARIEALRANNNPLTLEQAARCGERIQAFRDLLDRLQNLERAFESINLRRSELYSIDPLVDLKFPNKQEEARKIVASEREALKNLLAADEEYKRFMSSDVLQENVVHEHPLLFLTGIPFNPTNTLLQLNPSYIMSETTLDTISRRSADKIHRVVQMRVAGQSSAAGGSASCGYQALKNGLFIALATFCDEIDQPRVLRNLNDIALTQAFFGKTESGIGPWREKVIIERRKYIIRNVIYNYLLTILNRGNKETQRTRPKSVESSGKPMPLAVNFFRSGQIGEEYLVMQPYNEHDLAQGLTEDDRMQYASISKSVRNTIVESFSSKIGVTTGPNVFITGEQLLDYINQEIQARIQKNLTNVDEQERRETAERWARLGDPETIRKYFLDIGQRSLDVDRIIYDGRHGSWGKPLIDERQMEKYINDRVDGHAGTPGDWVISEEVTPIIEWEINHGLLHNRQGVSYCLLEDANSINERNVVTRSSFRDVVRTFHLNEDEFRMIHETLRAEGSAVIIIILMLPNHWIPVVINKVGEQRQYLISDSMGSNCIHAREIRELIQFIEEDLRPSDQTGEPVAAPSAGWGWRILGWAFGRQ